MTTKPRPSAVRGRLRPLAWLVTVAAIVLLGFAVAGFGVTTVLQAIVAIAFALLAAAILGLGAFVLLLGSG